MYHVYKTSLRISTNWVCAQCSVNSAPLALARKPQATISLSKFSLNDLRVSTGAAPRTRNLLSVGQVFGAIGSWATVIGTLGLADLSSKVSNESMGQG